MTDLIKQIKKLRQTTGLGFHDIKRALEEAEGNEKKALQLLKEWGLSTVAKKADRAANQGIIAAYVHDGRIGAMVEINCETDFVARNSDFGAFAKEIAMQIASMNPENVTALMKQEYFRDPSMTIDNLLAQTISRIGENIKINRFTRFEL